MRPDGLIFHVLRSDHGRSEQRWSGGTAAGNQPNLGVVAQYVKDLSFENPGAPGALRARTTPPTINVSIGVQPNASAADNEIEVELKIDARATDGEEVLFAVELVYAGVFRLTNIPPQDVAPLTLIECPRLLFPFARQVIADATRNGGFPPLLIDPVDFVSLYRQRMAEQQAQPSRPADPAGRLSFAARAQTPPGGRGRRGRPPAAARCGRSPRPPRSRRAAPRRSSAIPRATPKRKPDGEEVAGAR